MAHVLLLISLSLYGSFLITQSRHHQLEHPIEIHGRVYCDACRAGFETEKVFSIQGARVTLECISNSNGSTLYTQETTTDSNGVYVITVDKEHSADQYCHVKLGESPRKNCRTPSEGCRMSRVFLGVGGGLVSNQRFANPLGFLIDNPLPECDSVLSKYMDEAEAN